MGCDLGRFVVRVSLNGFTFDELGVCLGILDFVLRMVFVMCGTVVLDLRPIKKLYNYF